MFKIQNNQPTKANQQPLNEIELISGQEMVELSGQELMNVVGGKQGETEQQKAFFIELGDGTKLGGNYPPPGEATATPTNPEAPLTVKPVE